MRGTFIAIEGIDGAGTTTATRELCEALRQDGRSVYQTVAPSPLSPYYTGIRHQLSQETPSNSLLLSMFLQDRLWHWTNVVAPNLEKNEFVVTDRWHWSTIAYQGQSSGVDAVKAALGELYVVPYADLTYLLDVPVDAAQDRMSDRSNLDSFDSNRLLQSRARKIYQEGVKDCYTFVAIDATQGARGVVSDLFGSVSHAVAEL